VGVSRPHFLGINQIARGAMLGEQTFEGRRENLSLIAITATVQSLVLAGWSNPEAE
jgi:hypothetical protein